MPTQYGQPNQVYQPGGMPVQTPTSRPQQNWWSKFFMGTPQWNEQVQNFNPQQQQGFADILQRALGGQGLGNFDFAPIEKQARSQFEQKTIPSIAERFTSMGGQGSGAFAQALGSAGAGLEENLAAMKSNYNLQREPQLQNLLGQGLTKQFDTMMHGEQPGFLETGLSGLLGGLAGGAGQAYGTQFGNWAGNKSFGQAGQQGGGGGGGDMIGMLMKILPFLV